MSMFTSSIVMLLYPKGRNMRRSVNRVYPFEETRNRQDITTQQQFNSLSSRYNTHVRNGWSKVSILNAMFEKLESGSGAQSLKRSKEKLLDEQAWARMDDEGCPNGEIYESRLLE